MNEENVFMQSEMEMRPPPHANNCHGHKTSIAAGGNGHWSGDGCGCDTLSPSVSIDGYLWVLVMVAVILIKFTTKKKDMIYKGYTIEQDNTGGAPKNMQFAIFFDEEYIDSAESVEECKVIIDEIIDEEAD